MKTFVSTLSISLAMLSLMIGPAVANAGEKEALMLAETMQMPDQWGPTVMAPIIDRYIDKLRAADLPNLSVDEKKKQFAAVRMAMTNATSWDRLGKRFIAVTYGDCDNNVLTGMRNIVRIAISNEAEAKKLTDAFEACTKSTKTKNAELDKILSTEVALEFSKKENAAIRSLAPEAMFGPSVYDDL